MIICHTLMRVFRLVKHGSLKNEMVDQKRLLTIRAKEEPKKNSFSPAKDLLPKQLGAMGSQALRRLHQVTAIASIRIQGLVVRKTIGVSPGLTLKNQNHSF